MDNAGALYGVAQSGGAHSSGLVFKLSAPVAPKKAWTKTAIFAFDMNANGFQPNTPVAFGAGGRLYGMNLGTSNSGNVYELVPPVAPSVAWTINLLHGFSKTDGNNGDRTNLTIGPDGTLYGTTAYGGPATNCDFLGCGVAFRLVPRANNHWLYQVLYYFNRADSIGWYPLGGVALDANGALWGTTNSSLGIGCGTLFKLGPPAANGHWPITVQHDFSYCTRSASPLFWNGPILYGTTGDTQRATFGTVFRFVP